MPTPAPFPTTTITVASESTPGVEYVVTITGPTEASCTCPAAEHYPGPCKHARPILAELAEALGLEPPAPAPARAAPAPVPGADRAPSPDEWIAAERLLAAAEASGDAAKVTAARRSLRALEARERAAAGEQGAIADLEVPTDPARPSDEWRRLEGRLAVGELGGYPEVIAEARAAMDALVAAGAHVTTDPEPPPPCRVIEEAPGVYRRVWTDAA